MKYDEMKKLNDFLFNHRLIDVNENNGFTYEYKKTMIYLKPETIKADILKGLFINDKNLLTDEMIEKFKNNMKYEFEEFKNIKIREIQDEITRRENEINKLRAYNKVDNEKMNEYILLFQKIENEIF